MLKKMGKLFIVILIVAALTGCSGDSRVITIGDIEITKIDMRGNYSCFTGNYYKNVKVKEGESLAVAFSVNTEKGKLTAEVLDADGEAVTSIEPGGTVVIDESGKYKLQVRGEKHKGDFTLSWEIESMRSNY